MTFTPTRLGTRWILRNMSPARRFVTYPRLRLFLKRPIKNSRHWQDKENKPRSDPRMNYTGRAFKDEFAIIRDNYAMPKNPIVLAHGLMGFNELRLAGSLLPGVQYWRGITEAMKSSGIDVIATSVPATSSIEERALKLGKDIAAKADGKSVNIIAHSMGGLDARYMISRLQPDNVKVVSLTTVATPHRGSAFADFVLDEIGESKLYYFYEIFKILGMGTGAFSQLTRKYLQEFNSKILDDPKVRYFSYGATVRPAPWSSFRRPHEVIEKLEGPNDGLVSVASSRWGIYKGTLVDVSHLDLINWTNRLRWLALQMMGHERHFNAVAFYLNIADMLAKEGL